MRIKELKSADIKRTISELSGKLRSGILQMMSANAINKVIGFASTLVLARLLTEEEYGVWGYALNIYSYFQLATGLGLDSGALQFGTEHHGKGRAFAFFKYCIQRGLLIDICMVSVADMIFASCRLPIEGVRPYILLLLPILLLEFVMMIGRSVLHSQNRIKEYAGVLNVNTIALGLGTCCGAFWGIPGVLVGRYTAVVISVVYEISVISSHISDIRSAGVLSATEKKRLWHYSLFTGISSAMNIMVFSLDLTLIAALIKDAGVFAVYQIGTLIPNGLQFIPAAVITSVLPNIIYHRDDLKWTRSYLRKLFMGLAALNACITAFVIGFGTLIMKIITGGRYIDSVPVLRVLTLGWFFSGTFRSLSVNTLTAYKRVYYGLFISVTACVTDIILNYVFIFRFGMMGAAYATLCVDIITAALSFIYVFSLLRKGKIKTDG